MSSKHAMAMVALTVGLLGAVSALAGSTAASALEPVAGCGEGYELLTVEATLATIDQRPYRDAGTWGLVETAIRSYDMNGDDHLCSKVLPSNFGQDKKSGYDGHWSTNISENRAAGRV